MTSRRDQPFLPLKRGGRAALVAYVTFSAFLASCAPTAQAELQHMSDMPPFEGGRVLEDCGLSAEQAREVQGWEHRCVVLSRDEASGRLQSYAQQLEAKGWTGGAGGSAMFAMIPMGSDCAQMFVIAASDYPRGSETTATSEVVIDLTLEQRMRCGDERPQP